MGSREYIESGKAVMGIELGSTRIKAVLIGEDHKPLASGSYEWENQLVNNIWTYSLDEVWKGIQGCYQDLKREVFNTYGVTIKSLGAIGVSAMMHGYLAFDENDELLVPFRTWRNTITEEAADLLTEKLHYNIPQRWSIAHLYQAILNKEEHVKKITFFTTLAGYVHWKLTGEKVLGVGDASGMFPIDSGSKNYNKEMLTTFQQLISSYHYPWTIEELLPKVLSAGENGGYLTETGCKLLDVEGDLMAGIPLCPPEGDAGTGMVATNSVGVRTGNVSAGTSVFAMIVLEHALKQVHKEIDMVTTPSGETVAMVHCNNCTSDINAWVGLFQDFAESMHFEVNKGELFEMLFNKALEAEVDCGGLLSYNYFSGESITGLEEGRPVFVRQPDSHFTLANFMRCHLYSSLASLKIGLDILLKEEQVTIDKIMGHGGFFKTKLVGQRMMAAAMQTPVSVMETAGEGGAWGIAVLAAYMNHHVVGEDLSAYLNGKVFAGQVALTINPDSTDVEGFGQFMKHYTSGLEIERAAVNTIR